MRRPWTNSTLTGRLTQFLWPPSNRHEETSGWRRSLKDHRIKASRDVIAKSLRGDWRAEHLFTLKQTHALWQQHQQLIAECDAQIAAMLKAFDAKVDVASAPLPLAKSSHKKAQRDEPQFDARTECYRVLGVDLTCVPGFASPTVLVMMCELGPEFAEKFATAKSYSPAGQIKKMITIKNRPARTALSVAPVGR